MHFNRFLVCFNSGEEHQAVCICLFLFLFLITLKFVFVVESFPLLLRSHHGLQQWKPQDLRRIEGNAAIRYKHERVNK